MQKTNQKTIKKKKCICNTKLIKGTTHFRFSMTDIFHILFINCKKSWDVYDCRRSKSNSYISYVAFLLNCLFVKKKKYKCNKWRIVWFAAELQHLFTIWVTLSTDNLIIAYANYIYLKWSSEIKRIMFPIHKFRWKLKWKCHTIKVCIYQITLNEKTC